MLNAQGPNDEKILSILQYMALISTRAKGFVFQDIHIMENGKKRLLGVLWMTATMRRNFELFGGYVCFDMMKRGLNKLLWPYTAVALYDEMEHLCLACEGFVCGERFDTYLAQCRFLEQHAPGRPLSSVDIASADGYFDKEMLVTLGLTNASFFADHHHLKESGLVERFGKGTHDLLSVHLHRMMDAHALEQFEQTLASARDLLNDQPVLDANAMQALDDFAKERDTYAAYCLAQVVGNRGRMGNVAAESNHASVLINLNDGVRGINTYTEDPIIFAKDLLVRQQKWMIAANGRVHKMWLKMEVEQARLSLAPESGTNSNLIRAAKVLNLVHYERFKKGTNLAGNYGRSTEMHPELGIEMTCVRRLDVDDPKTWWFENWESRCDCADHKAHEDMCVHEIVAKDGFHECFFLPRHRARQRVEGLLLGWTPPSRQAMDEELLGCSPGEHLNADASSADANTDGMMGTVEEHNLEEESDEHCREHAGIKDTSKVPPGYLPA